MAAFSVHNLFVFTGLCFSIILTTVPIKVFATPGSALILIMTLVLC